MRATQDALFQRLRNGPALILDGPTGTELERNGADTSGPLWSAAVVRDRPDLIRDVHHDHATAGAEVLTTATFRAHEQAFRDAGSTERDHRRVIAEAVRLAREVADGAPHSVWVAGSIGPVGDCYQVDEVPPEPVLRSAHRVQAERLAEAGVDLLLFETIGTIQEAITAVQAASATGVPVVMSFLVLDGARTLAGESLADALHAVQDDVVAFGVNCADLDAVHAAVPLLQAGDRPWGVYANGSPGDPVRGWSGDAYDPRAYAAAARLWLEEGAAFVGGCCGTTSAHVAAVRRERDTRLQVA